MKLNNLTKQNSECNNSNKLNRTPRKNSVLGVPEIDFLKPLEKQRPKSLLDDLANSTLIINESNLQNGNLVLSFNSNSYLGLNNLNSLPDNIAIMEVIFRLLQLLCENHNSELQSYLRLQSNNKTNFNLVCKTLQFLDCLCGSTTGCLGGLLGLWVNEQNVHLIIQTLKTLTEYCQGPCRENQFALINHESNGIDIIISIILNDIQPLSKNDPEMFFELKDNASKLLLSLIESNDDVFNAERILYNIKPKTLISLIKEIYNQGKQIEIYLEYEKHGSIESLNESDFINTSSKCELVPDSPNENLINKNEPNSSLPSSRLDYSRSFYSVITSSSVSNKSLSSLYFSSFLSICSTDSNENENSNQSNNKKATSPLEVGHSLYILAQKLAKFNKELRILLKTEEAEKNPAFLYYTSRTAQIEVI
jgi:hypothetical protein